ncbi:hypothetical protein [Streptococcus sp. zg-JUN1979]
MKFSSRFIWSAVCLVAMLLSFGFRQASLGLVFLILAAAAVTIK